MPNKCKLKRNDFHRYNTVFRLWLRETYDIHFQDVKFIQLKSLFKAFCKEWNSDQLPGKYYNWEFDLLLIKVSWGLKDTLVSSSRVSKRSVQTTREVDSDEEQKKIVAMKKQQKRFLKENEELLEELVPKKEGKHRFREKRRYTYDDNEPEREIFDTDNDYGRLLRLQKEKNELMKQREMQIEEEKQRKIQVYRQKELDLKHSFQ